MIIDGNLRRNLEFIESIREKSKKGLLFWVLDKSVIFMGGRIFRKWIDEFLIIKFEIEKRLNGVNEIFNFISFNEDLRSFLKEIYDIERIVGKILNKNVNVKDMLFFKVFLDRILNIKEFLKYVNLEFLKEYYENLDELDDIRNFLLLLIKEDLFLSIKEGNIIKDGYNLDVDELREFKIYGKEWIVVLENKEREFIGIKFLKVGYNKVFGYYIEILKLNYSFILEGRYIRKQILVNVERYIIEEFKVMEDKILGVEEKFINLEYLLFVDIRDSVEKEILRFKKSVRILLFLDVILILVLVVFENDYVKL